MGQFLTCHKRIPRPTPPGIIDAAVHPHLFRAILAHADHSTLLTLRLLATRWRDDVEAELFRVVELTPDPAPLLPTSGVMPVLPTRPTSVLPTHAGRRLPLLPLIPTPVPGMANARRIDPKTAETWVRAFAHTRVLECGRHELDFAPFLDGYLPLPALRVVRNATGLAAPPPAHTYVDVWGRNSRIAAPPFKTKRHVILVRYADLGDVPVALAPGGRGRELVVVFLPVRPADSADAADAIESSKGGIDLVPFLPAIASHARCTVVGAAPPPQGVDSVELLQRICDAYPASTARPTPAEMEGRVRFITAEEWRDEIGRQEWEAVMLGGEGGRVARVMEAKGCCPGWQ